MKEVSQGPRSGLFQKAGRVGPGGGLTGNFSLFKFGYLIGPYEPVG